MDAERVLVEMMEASLEPDNTTYTIVIEAKVTDSEELKSAKGMVLDLGFYSFTDQ